MDRIYPNETIEQAEQRLTQMRIDWGKGRDWTADPMEGSRQIKRLAKAIARAKGES